MKLTIKNVSSLKHQKSVANINMNDVSVEPDQYIFYFDHSDYFGGFEATLKRNKQNRFQLGWNIHLRPDDSNSKSIDYPIYRDDVLASNNFLNFLNNICHDWDIVNNK